MLTRCVADAFEEEERPRGGGGGDASRPAAGGARHDDGDDDEDARLNAGLIDARALARFLPPPGAAETAVLVCGPPGMMRALCGGAARAPDGAHGELGGLMRALGYEHEQVVRFD